MKKGSVKFWDRREPIAGFRWNPFSIHGMAPGSVRREPISATIAAIMGSTLFTIGGGATGMVGTIAATGATYAVAGVATTITVGQVLSAALLVGSLGYSMLSMSNQGIKSPSSLRSGTLVNGHSPGDTMRIVYGSARTGGTWGWWRTTSSGPNKMNTRLHIIIGWCEGVCALDKDLEQPLFKGAGLNDCISSGTYTGATYSKYQIQIDGVETFKWRVGTGGWTTGVAITRDWQDLNDGAKIKFTTDPAISGGHTVGDQWEMYGGDGLWIEDRLYYSFQGVAVEGGTVDYVVTHNFHPGDITQAVDTDLLTTFPWYTNPHRNTCYSYIQLKGNLDPNLDVWQSIPDCRIRVKKVDILDPRDNSVGFSRNAALVYYDFLTHQRYGRGLNTSKVVESDIIAAANWCDPDVVTNDGETYTCIGDHTSAAATEPGTGANWETFWEVGGSGVSAWASGAYYRMGYTFDGVIIDRKEANEHLKAIAQNFLGYSFESDGKTRLKVWDDDASSGTFAEMEKEISINPDDFTIEQSGMESSPDIVIAHFTNPKKNWGADTIAYPDDGSLVALPPSGTLVQIDIDLIGTTSKRRAKQLAKSTYLRLNLSNRFKALCHPKLFAYEPGDMITCTHEYPNWVAKKLRIDTYGVIQSGLVPIVLIDEAATLYDLEVQIKDEDSNVSSIPDIDLAPSAPTDPTEVSLDLHRDDDNAKWYDEGTITFQGSYYEGTLSGYDIQLWGTWGGTDHKVGQLMTEEAEANDERATADPPDNTIHTVSYKKRLAVKKAGVDVIYFVQVRAYNKDKIKSNWVSSAADSDPAGVPDAPTWVTTNPISASKLAITVAINKNTETDIAGYEYHFKEIASLAEIDFTPDASTLMDSRKTTVFTWHAPTKGLYACKVIAYDDVVPPNKSDPSEAKSIDLALPSKVTGVTVKNLPLWVDPVSNVTFAQAQVKWAKNPDAEEVDIYEILWGSTSFYLYVGKAYPLG